MTQLWAQQHHDTAAFLEAVYRLCGSESYIEDSYVQNCQQLGTDLNGAFLVDRTRLPGSAPAATAAASLGELATSTTPAATSNWFSWSDGKSGLFGAEIAQRGGLGMEASFDKDMLAFEIVLETPAKRAYYFRDQVLQCEANGLNVAYLPGGSKWGLILSEGRFRSLTILIDVASFLAKLSSFGTRLPAVLERTLSAGNSALIETPIPLSMNRLIDDIFQASGRLKHAPLYFEAKTIEVTSLVMEYLSRGTEDQAWLSPRDIRSAKLAKDYIDRNPRVDIGVEQLSSLAAMNRTKLRALFKEAYGSTISEYRTSKVMERADSLLSETDIPVSEVGLTLGYADTSGFIVAYKRYFGHSPGQIRRRRKTAYKDRDLPLRN